MTARFVFLAAALFAALAHAQTTDREKELLDRIDQLEKRVAALEAALKQQPPPPTSSTAPTPTPEPSTPSGILSGTTLNFLLDGYYEYNFNRPADRVNPLRPLDPTSNGFSLDQAAMIVERAPDPAQGRRFGVRLDLLFGQATEALGGNPANEPRTSPYRNIYQAYGTYVVPLGTGLNVDFGRFASSLGMESLYMKDQIAYTRSLLYAALPFYHMGFRTSYKLNGAVTATWELVNGLNQTEDFNGFKSNHFMLAFAPSSKLSWTAGYYVGRESSGPVSGRTHIADTYLSYSATSKLTLAGEGDYIISRTTRNAAPSYLAGVAGYLKYQLRPPFYLAGRFEYISDHAYLSAIDQYLKEATLTAAYQPVNGFQLRWEFRRDFSNRSFFPGTDQNTALLGLLWWFGGKQGTW